MVDDLAPRFGARFLFSRGAPALDDSQAVCYEVSVRLPSVQYDFTLRIGHAQGECVLSDERRTATIEDSAVQAAPLPPWAHKHLLALARQLYRAAKKDGVWTRRLSRWHGDPADERERPDNSESSENENAEAADFPGGSGVS